MERESNTKIWIWAIIIVATILIVITAVYLVLSKIEPEKEKDSLLEKTELDKSRSGTLEFALDLQKNYVGTLKTENGSVQAVLLEIKNINKQLNSFDYSMNIGVQSKSVSTGSLDFIKSTIYSTEFGELSFRIDQNGRIILINANPNIYPKFELFEELK